MGMVRCSVCNDMTSDRSAEAYDGKCPACHRALKKLAEKANNGKSGVEIQLEESLKERDRKLGTGIVSIAGMGGKFPSDKMREIVEKMQTGQVHLQVPLQQNKSQFMKDLIEVSKKMAEEGAIKMPILEEGMYREKIERERNDMELGNTIKNLRTPEEDARMDEFFQKNVIEGRHTVEVPISIGEAFEQWKIQTESINKMKAQGTYVTQEEYDAELAEHPESDPIVKASRREAALRTLADSVTNDVLMNLYKECIISRERMKNGRAFGIASEVEIESRLQVYETELGNRLARKGKGK